MTMDRCREIHTGDFVDIWSRTAEAWVLALVTDEEVPRPDGDDGDLGKHITLEYALPGIGDCRKSVRRTSELLETNPRDPKAASSSSPSHCHDASTRSPRRMLDLDNERTSDSFDDLDLLNEVDPESFRSCFGGLLPKSPSSDPGQPVYINIYNVGDQKSISWLNSLLAPRYSPLKLCGIFHVGVEIDGREFAFGANPYRVCGVYEVRPRQDPCHEYRQSLRMRNTFLSNEELPLVYDDMKTKYLSKDYDLLTMNCCHFAEHLLVRIGAGTLPGWINRLARIGDEMDKKGLLPKEEDTSYVKLK